MKKIINFILRIANLRLTKSTNANHHTKCLNYISAKETVLNAKQSGLSVCDYVEKLWNQVGETQKVIDRMDKFGVFEKPTPTICEIGAGTGRYMGKIMERCHPISYESYETASDWAAWLEKEYKIISQDADGNSLSGTKDNSMDIIHSHGVFVYLPFFDSLRYFREIDRISSKNSMIVFDCLTEDCLDKNSLENWLSSSYNYPRILSEKYIFAFFPAIKYDFVGSFFTPYGQGKSKYFIFRKK